MQGLSVPRWSGSAAVVVAALALVALIGWQGVTTVGRDGALDARAHLAYAQHLAHRHSLPSSSDTYEYTSPPLFAALAVAAEEAQRLVPSHAFEPGPDVVNRLLWLVLVVGGAAALTAARRTVRLCGAVSLLVATVWGLDEALSLGRSENWVSGQLVALGACLGLAATTVLIARELCPGRRGSALATGAVAVAYPVLLRMGVLFHPETTFACISAVTILLVLRAARRDWPLGLAAAAGAGCGLAALTRQSGVVLALCVLAVAALAAGSRARRFTLVAACALLLVAGPWWAIAYHRWGNPLQSNLDRPGYMLPHGQPASFFVSFPIRDLVVHPYRPKFANELLPKLHAELWSDWFGGIHHLWSRPSRLDRITASTQSVLGLAGDVLALGGLAIVGVPSLSRLSRRRTNGPPDVGWALLGLLAVASFAAYVVTLVRFPQASGDPIKSSYLLFTLPCWAAFTVAAWSEIRRRSAIAHGVLVVVGALYVASYAVTLGAALG